MSSAQGAQGAAARGPLPAAVPASGRRGALWLGLGVGLLGCAGYMGWKRFSADEPWISGYRVVHTYPHDPEAYCQGLVYDGGVLHESTGREGKSTVRTVKLETGEVLKKTALPDELFGEGLAMVGDRLIQLTWTSQVARIYDKATLTARDQFEYDGEGWGLAYDGQHLIQSNGSEYLVFRDPATFAEVRRVRVLERGAPVSQLNELELVGDEVWANIWKSDRIVRIDPDTGQVQGYVDLTGLFDKRKIQDPDGVLNGIAWDAEHERLFVTGKLWPNLFEIELVAK